LFCTGNLKCNWYAGTITVNSELDSASNDIYFLNVHATVSMVILLIIVPRRPLFFLRQYLLPAQFTKLMTSRNIHILVVFCQFSLVIERYTPILQIELLNCILVEQLLQIL
jgi:hypothetical protein